MMFVGRPSWRRQANVLGVTVIGVVVAVSTVGCVNPATNFRVVEKDTLYRSGQMSPRQLRRAIQRHELGAVINLRGSTPAEEWYVEERAVCREQGVAHHDFGWLRRLRGQ